MYNDDAHMHVDKKAQKTEMRVLELGGNTCTDEHADRQCIGPTTVFVVGLCARTHWIVGRWIGVEH
jgi:hypothetical protein